VYRTASRQEQQRSQSELKSGPWQRRQFELACETNQHVMSPPKDDRK
jgi:hypothetical protein